MSTRNCFVITQRRTAEAEERSAEICEHKGVGHPDSLCDGVAEAVSRARVALRRIVKVSEQTRTNGLPRSTGKGGSISIDYAGVMTAAARSQSPLAWHRLATDNVRQQPPFRRGVFGG